MLKAYRTQGPKYHNRFAVIFLIFQLIHKLFSTSDLAIIHVSEREMKLYKAFSFCRV
jgi:hypothetical protein